MGSPGKKPRILLVTRNFPPLTGGMERLMLNACQGIANWADLTIVGPRGCVAWAPQQARVYESPEALIPFLICSAWQSLRAIASGKFDVILGGSGLVAPVLLMLRRLNGGKTIVFLHGLDLVVGSRLYQTVFVPCICRTDLCIVNSRNTMNLAMGKGVSKKRLAIVHPGTDLYDSCDVESRASFCHRRQISFQKIIIFVGRMTQRKGLSRFIESSLPDILEASPDAGLVIAGDNPNQGLTSFGEKERVLATVAQLKLTNKVVFLGQLNDEDLRACYAAADVQVFPLIEIPGDVEGFGMVAKEAAACGTPTVAFDLGGVSDAICEDNGLLVKAGDYHAFGSAVLQVLLTAHPDANSCIKHAQQFGWKQYHSRIRSLLEASILQKESNNRQELE